jgi:glucan phosphoethanolaminetransferase (alkaline phosphatase superfamily)
MKKQQRFPKSTNKEISKNTFRRRIPRTEALILAIGLGCTIWGKLTIIQRQGPPNFLTQLTQVVLPDLLFFTVILFIVFCLYTLKPSALTARCTLVIAATVSVWSVLNAGWLIKTGVQLQPGVLMVLIRNPKEIWPFVQVHLRASFKVAILLLAAASGILGYFIWCLLRPEKFSASRAFYSRRAVGAGLAVIILSLMRPAVSANTNQSFTTEVLNFSSHWYALVSTITVPFEDTIQTRQIAQAGQRQVLAPKYSPNDLPNVVLVFLESISYSSSSLGNPEATPMPFLAQLAKEGTEFYLTRVPVSSTTKAFWASLTSTTPSIQEDYVEAVPVEMPYESLATLLARIGYRSGFFEMSKGSFECGPGLFNNLGFDWAWFRENLQDPSTYLGYLAGDDCKMIEPVFQWVLKGSQPFLLMIITSTSHDPFEVPDWFDKPKEKPYDKYLQTVKFTDYFLEQFCAALKSHNLENNTILCIIGDHGTSFRGQAGKGRWNPYEEIIRVPWVIRWPGHINAGQRIDWPCSQLDVTPTILKLIGFDITNAGFEGKDAFVFSEPDRRLYFSSGYSKSPLGFIEGNQKVVYWPYLDKVFEYNLGTDPNEQNPTTVSLTEMQQIKNDIMNWRNRTQIVIDPRRFTDRVLYSHWQTFSTGRLAWSYYVQ